MIKKEILYIKEYEFKFCLTINQNQNFDLHNSMIVKSIIKSEN